MPQRQKKARRLQGALRADRAGFESGTRLFDNHGVDPRADGKRGVVHREREFVRRRPLIV